MRFIPSPLIKALLYEFVEKRYGRSNLFFLPNLKGQSLGFDRGSLGVFLVKRTDVLLDVGTSNQHIVQIVGYR